MIKVIKGIMAFAAMKFSGSNPSILNDTLKDDLTNILAFIALSPWIKSVNFLHSSNANSKPLTNDSLPLLSRTYHGPHKQLFVSPCSSKKGLPQPWLNCMGGVAWWTLQFIIDMKLIIPNLLRLLTTSIVSSSQIVYLALTSNSFHINCYNICFNLR